MVVSSGESGAGANTVATKHSMSRTWVQLQPSCNLLCVCVSHAKNSNGAINEQGLNKGQACQALNSSLLLTIPKGQNWRGFESSH